MGEIRNILFIMYDQLRFDYLGCAGHPSLPTPNFDRLANMGMRFTRAYAQSPICGASRMCTYTGRYAHSHGAQWNGYPLRVGELTIGDHLRRLGMECWLIGKTHMTPDHAGMDRLGISRNGLIGTRLAECGFDIWIRDDGLWAEGPDGFYDSRRSPYNEYLRSKGYESDNPWNEHANAGIDENGQIASGWFLRNADRPANIREEDSETPWLTSRAIDFLQRDSDAPWLAHLSYIKPHWPYIVPAPYHGMFGPDDLLPAHRHERELQDPHPVLAEYHRHPVAMSFRRQEVRDKVIPAYMGLIRQCDNQFGRLLDHLAASGRLNDTMIVVTSDHGDYLGDHWLGEKDMFHECAVKIPLIIYDPSPLADAARGTHCDEAVESIDLAATFIEAAGGEIPDHIVEGRSLMPFLRGLTPAAWREYVISEYDYSPTQMAANLGLSAREARLFMVADKRWKYIHSDARGHRPILFDLQEDPDEFIDLGGDPGYRQTIERMQARLGTWARRMAQRTTRSDAEIEAMRGASDRKGILFGAYSEADADPELVSMLTRNARQKFT